MIWRAKQNIDYPIINKMTLQEGEMWPDLTYIHTDIAVDSKQRLWVTTLKIFRRKKAHNRRSSKIRTILNFEFSMRTAYGWDEYPCLFLIIRKESTVIICI